MEDLDVDTGEEHFKRVATAAHEARERRLTAGQQALERAEQLGTPLGDADVEIVTQRREWCQLPSDSEEEPEPRRVSVATESFVSRERRLTAGAEVLGLAAREGSPVGGDYDVEVVPQEGEWAQMPEDSDDGGEAQLRRRATEAHLARERRLTAGSEALAAAVPFLEGAAQGGAREVAVVAQGREWQGLEEDSDDEGASAKRLSLHASSAHKARERRLTASAEALRLSPLQPSLPVREQEIAVVSQNKEWAEFEDSDGDDGAKAVLCRHAADVHKARERRLSVRSEALLSAPLLQNHTGGEQEVVVVSQSQEWGELERDSDDEEDQLERHAADALLARERRLTLGAEALSLGPLQQERAAGRDVALVTEAQEWRELKDDSDVDEGSESHFRRHATNAHTKRERRLTLGAEALTLAPQAPQPSESDREVEVVAQDVEWHELDNHSDEDVAGPEQLSRHASDAHAAREKRLTAGADAIALAMRQPATASQASNGIAVVAQTNEWRELEDDSDEEAASSQHLSRRATDAQIAREKRLSIGAEALALRMPQPTALSKPSQAAAVVAQSTEWGGLDVDSDDGEAAEDHLLRHATEVRVARERRLTAGAEAIAFAQQPAIPAVASKGMASIVVQSKEWNELKEDSDDDTVAPEEKLSCHAANAHVARERRLTAGAESMAIAMQQPVASAVSSKDIAVFAQTTEWRELEEDSDEDAAKEGLSRHATDAHTARERRLTAGAAAIASSMEQPAIKAIAAKDVKVVSQSAEWGELEDDSDQEAAAPEQLSRHAIGTHLARERRLSAGAEAVAIATLQPLVPATSSEDVVVVGQGKEWCELGRDSDEDATPQERLSRHAFRAHTARERRLTAGAEAIANATHHPSASSVSPKDVAVVAQTNEWDELGDVSDDDAAGLEQHATDAHVAREKRLTVGAEALAMALHLQGHVSNQDVEVIAQSKEWVEMEGDSEEENVAAWEKLCRHASDTLKARERRLTAGAEALQLTPGLRTVA